MASAHEAFQKLKRQKQHEQERKRAWLARKRQRPDRFYRLLVRCMNKRRWRDADD